MSQPLLDLATIQEEYEGADDILLNLVTKALDQIPVFVQEIRKTFENKDYERMKSQSHAFKGVISYLYISPFVDILDKIELFSPDTNDLDVSNAVSEVERMAGLLIVELKEAFPKVMK